MFARVLPMVLRNLSLMDAVGERVLCRGADDAVFIAILFLMAIRCLLRLHAIVANGVRDYIRPLVFQEADRGRAYYGPCPCAPVFRVAVPFFSVPV